MNPKIAFYLLLCGLLFFSLGWLVRDSKQSAPEVVSNEIPTNNIQEAQSHFVQITQSRLDSLMIFANINNTSENYATKISGRFIIKDANCAGFNFINPSLVSWTNEIDCSTPDTLKIRWLDHATFYTQDRVQLNENCPPRVWIYQVVSFDGSRLILKDLWTGWNDPSDERIEFIKQEDKG